MTIDCKVEGYELKKSLDEDKKNMGRRIYEGFSHVCESVGYVIVSVALLSYLLAPSIAMAKPKKVKQVVVKEVTVVEGKIQKPEVWYLLPRSNLSFGSLKTEKKLAPKIEKVIENDIFNVMPKY